MKMMDWLSKPLLRKGRLVTVGTLFAVIILSFAFDVATGGPIDFFGRILTSVFATYIMAYIETVIARKR